MSIYTSITDGYWDDLTTWDGGVPPGAGVPGDGDSAVVDSGDTVTIRGNVTVGTDAGATTSAITVNNGGVLDWEANGDYTLTLKGRILVNAGGVWRVGDATNRIPVDKTATVVFGGSFEFQNVVEGEMYLYGAENYHMANEASQRAQLITDVLAGADRQFSVDAGVDWLVDDVLWIGTGGDPTETPTDCEQIVIKTKIDDHTFTADFVNDHFGDGTFGDLVIHGTRNVIISGQGAAQGFSFYTNITHDWTWNISWVRFVYGGRAATAGAAALNVSSQGVADYRVSTDSLKLQSTVFDKPGDTSAVGFYWNQAVWEEDQAQENFNEVHFWGFAKAIMHTSYYGRLLYGHLSFLNGATGIDHDTTMYAYIKGLWYSSDVTWTNSARVASLDTVMVIENFKIHRCYIGVSVLDKNSSYLSSCDTILDNGEIFHSYTSGLHTAVTGVGPSRVLIRDVDFYTSRNSLVNINMEGANITFVNCQFDGGNSLSGNTDGAIEVTITGVFFQLSFQNCDFGLRERNEKYNVFVSSTSYPYACRVIAESCVFKEPANFTASAQDWFNEHLLWSIGYNVLADWRERCTFPMHRTFEYVACTIQNAAGADQWAIDYPNTDRVGVIAAGGEIHKTHQTNEASGYIDGTFQRKILPFMGTHRTHVTRSVPIGIPVGAGETVTVNLSFKKNVSQDILDLPAIHVEGCGVYSEAMMSDVNNTWDEVSVSVTAICSGTLKFWVSCKGVQDFHTPALPPVRTVVDEYAWAYPYDPGDAANLILYADGFSVERT